MNGSRKAEEGSPTTSVADMVKLGAWDAGTGDRTGPTSQARGLPEEEKEDRKT